MSAPADRTRTVVLDSDESVARRQTFFVEVASLDADATFAAVQALSHEELVELFTSVCILKDMLGREAKGRLATLVREMLG